MDDVQRAVVRALPFDNASHIGQYMLVSKAWYAFVKQAALADIVQPYHKQAPYVRVSIYPRRMQYAVALRVTYPCTQRYVYGIDFTTSQYEKGPPRPLYHTNLYQKYKLVRNVIIHGADCKPSHLILLYYVNMQPMQYRVIIVFAGWTRVSLHLPTLKALLDLAEANGVRVYFRASGSFSLYWARSLDEQLGTACWGRTCDYLEERAGPKEWPGDTIRCRRLPLAAVEHMPRPYDWQGYWGEEYEVTRIDGASLMLQGFYFDGVEQTWWSDDAEREGWCPCASCRARVPALSEVASMH